MLPTNRPDDQSIIVGPARGPACFASAPRQRIIPVSVKLTLLAAATGYFVSAAALPVSALAAPPTSNSTVPHPSGEGPIVGLKLRNNMGRMLAAHEITFGQTFLQGRVPATSQIDAIVNGQRVPVQMDVRTTNPDGSVRMAVLTMMQPAIAAGDTENVMLTLAPPGSAAGTPVEITALASGGYQVNVDLTLHNADGSTTPYNLNLATLLQRALQSRTVTYLLRGPQVTEAQFSTPISGSLRLTCVVRRYASGMVRTDLQFNNDIAMSASGGTANYDVTITRNGRTEARQSGIKQAQYTTWHWQISSSSAPQAQVIEDIRALEETGAIPNYDLEAGVNSATIAAEGHSFGGPTYGILGSANVAQYMPMTGGRPDIGLQPEWVAAWLMTQNPTAMLYALAQAEAAGSIPWHFIDLRTGSYLTVTAHPNLWTDPRANTANGYTPLTQPVPSSQQTGWTLDSAHQPDLAYVPYLMTGNAYYLDQLNAQASWAVADVWVPPRQSGLGIVANGQDQVRAQAWNLREVDEAAYANPDGSPMKRYFTALANNNWRWLVSQIPTWTAEEGQAYGYVPGTYGSGGTVMAPWEQDYFVSAAVEAAEQGNQDAVTFLKWETNFIAGRFLNAANGFNPRDGVAYNISVYSSPGKSLQTWAEIGAATRAAGNSNGNSWGRSNGDYGELALQSLAGIITVTGSPEAERAYRWLQESGAPYIHPIADPQFNIVPRQSNGKLLTETR
jgi:hypothetical protein